MDAIIKKIPLKPVKRPSQEEAEAAVRVLLAWAGDDPDREGLLDTPKRVAKAFREYFSGYEDDPAEALSRTFDEVGGYDDIVMLRDIEFNLFEVLGRGDVLGSGPYEDVDSDTAREMLKEVARLAENELIPWSLTLRGLITYIVVYSGILGLAGSFFFKHREAALPGR